MLRDERLWRVVRCRWDVLVGPSRRSSDLPPAPCRRVRLVTHVRLSRSRYDGLTFTKIQHIIRIRKNTLEASNPTRSCSAVSSKTVKDRPPRGAQGPVLTFTVASRRVHSCVLRRDCSRCSPRGCVMPFCTRGPSNPSFVKSGAWCVSPWCWPYNSAEVAASAALMWQAGRTTKRARCAMARTTSWSRRKAYGLHDRRSREVALVLLSRAKVPVGKF